LVGANGSGKTTLVDVLTGLLPAQSGHVEIDGIALSDANRDAWRSTVAYVPQQIFLLDATLAENVAMGVPPSQIDPKRLRTAVRLAHLEECVEALPNRYDELLGERGCRLSGGQRQRLAIARALYRGASLLIMDEATSALDAAAEREIVDMLATLGRERTIVMVAHRLHSLRNCDVVFEMEKGRILHSGSYRQLMALS
jgi:ATP-binding cassette subfamily B protein